MSQLTLKICGLDCKGNKTSWKSLGPQLCQVLQTKVREAQDRNNSCFDVKKNVSHFHGNRFATALTLSANGICLYPTFFGLKIYAFKKSRKFFSGGEQMFLRVRYKKRDRCVKCKSLGKYLFLKATLSLKVVYTKKQLHNMLNFR